MDYELIILHTLVEIVMDEDASEHLKELRIAALNKVLRRLNAYHHLGFIRPLTTAIAEKKCRSYLRLGSLTLVSPAVRYGPAMKSTGITSTKWILKMPAC